MSGSQKTKKPYSLEAKELTQELKGLLQAQGQATFRRDWLLTGYAVAESLLKQGKTPEEIRQVMRWAATEWACKESITHFKGVQSAFPYWERQQAKNAPSCAPQGQDSPSKTFLETHAVIEHRYEAITLNTADCTPQVGARFTHEGVNYSITDFEPVLHGEVMARV